MSSIGDENRTVIHPEVAIPLRYVYYIIITFLPDGSSAKSLPSFLLFRTKPLVFLQSERKQRQSSNDIDSNANKPIYHLMSLFSSG